MGEALTIRAVAARRIRVASCIVVVGLWVVSKRLKVLKVLKMG
jgi:hypothetical protein